MQVEIPRWGPTGTSAGAQVENLALSESSPTATLESAEIKTHSGQVYISAQLSERGFKGGGTMDAVVGRQVLQSVNESLEKYVLSQAITNGEKVTGEATFSWKGLLKDLALAKEKLQDSGGVRLRPECLVTSSDFYNFATRQEDKTNVPSSCPRTRVDGPL